MKISKKTIDEIFNIVIIEEVISEFVSLKKTGANYKGLSPFNDEKTPSFVVSPSKEIWKDFSSGKGGNVISFLMEHEQYTYPEALLFLAKKYNIEVEYLELDAKAQKQEEDREATAIVLKFTKQIFCENLFQSDNIAIRYLKERGFNDSIIKKFEIGYCPKGDKELVQVVKKRGYNVKYLHKARIINEKEYNRFSGRLIFPIHNLTGQVLGFGGRVLNSSNKAVKYLNSDSSDLYQKSKVLYGLHFAKKYIKNLDFCYIVEGYTDVIAMYQLGIKNVVSNCGTALTKDQIRLIKRFTNNITLLFDSDSAGVLATIKAIDAILQQNMTPHILQLPDQDDPASFIKNNPETFINQYVKNNPVDFIEFKYNLSKNNTTIDLIKKTKEIIQSLSIIPDKISQTFHIRRAAKILSIKEEDLIIELNKIHSEKISLNRVRSIKPVKKEDKELDFIKIKKHHLEEFQLIRLIINYGDSEIKISEKEKISVSKFIILELESDSIQFSIPLFNQIMQESKKNINADAVLSKDYFLTHVESSVRVLTSYIIGEEHFLGNWGNKDIIVLEEKDLLLEVTRESILRFKLHRVKEMVKESLSKLKNDQDDNEDNLNQFTRLNKLEKKIHKELGRLF